LFKNKIDKDEIGISQSQLGAPSLDAPHSLENQSGTIGGRSGYLAKSSQNPPREKKKFIERAAKLIGRKDSKTLINFDIICLGKEIIASCQNIVQLSKFRGRAFHQDVFGMPSVD